MRSAPVVLVRDLELSRKFYTEVLGRATTIETGDAEVAVHSDFALQSFSSWLRLFGPGDGRSQGRPAGGIELRLEENDFPGFMHRLSGFGDIDFLHGPFSEIDSHLTVRLFDPDGHLIEVCESSEAAARRMWLGPKRGFRGL